jgi:hypothetical protein
VNKKSVLDYRSARAGGRKGEPETIANKARIGGQGQDGNENGIVGSVQVLTGKLQTKRTRSRPREKRGRDMILNSTLIKSQVGAGGTLHFGGISVPKRDIKGSGQTAMRKVEQIREKNRVDIQYTRPSRQVKAKQRNKQGWLMMSAVNNGEIRHQKP